MVDIKKKALITWNFLNNSFDRTGTDVVTAGDTNAYQFVVTLDGVEEQDLTGYKLTTFYQSKSSANSGIIKPVSATDNVFTIDLPVEMMVAGDTAVCFSLGNDKEVLGSIIFDFVIQRNLMTSVANEVNNNLTDFHKLFLAQLPDDVVERMNAQLALIAKKAEQTALDATNAEVAKKATITSVNQKMPVITSANTSTGLAYVVTSTNLPTLSDGYTFVFIPSITSTSQSATVTMNGVSYTFAKRGSYTSTFSAVSTDNAPVDFLKASCAYVVTVRVSALVLNTTPDVERSTLATKATFLSPSSLASATDLNTLTGYGQFIVYLLNGQTITNLPTNFNNYSSMTVCNGTQTVTDLTTGEIATRSISGGTWGTWLIR